MWLSRDERRLLAGYYSLLGGISKRKAYKTADLIPLLRFYGHKRHISEYGKSEASSKRDLSNKQLKRDIKRCIKRVNRIDTANALLVERKLINITEHESVDGVILIELTLQGHDLGRKYTSPLKASGLLFQECRKHWLWLLIFFFAGAICKSLIDAIMGRVSGN